MLLAHEVSLYISLPGISRPPGRTPVEAAGSLPHIRRIGKEPLGLIQLACALLWYRSLHRAGEVQAF